MTIRDLDNVRCNPHLQALRSSLDNYLFYRPEDLELNQCIGLPNLSVRNFRSGDGSEGWSGGGSPPAFTAKSKSNPDHANWDQSIVWHSIETIVENKVLNKTIVTGIKQITQQSTRWNEGAKARRLSTPDTNFRNVAYCLFNRPEARLFLDNEVSAIDPWL